jgi:isoamylase
MDQGRIWSDTDGSPNPLGATWLEECQAFNFAIYSKYATSVTLLCYGATDFVEPVFRLEFDLRKNRTGRTWHARVCGELLRDAKYYAYRIDGPPPSSGRFERHAFNPRKILLDPYSRAIFFPPEFDRRAAIDPGANDGRAPLGILARSLARQGRVANIRLGSPSATRKRARNLRNAPEGFYARSELGRPRSAAWHVPRRDR